MVTTSKRGWLTWPGRRNSQSCPPACCSPVSSRASLTCWTAIASLAHERPEAGNTVGHARRSFLTSLVSGLVATANAKIRSARPARAPAAPGAAAPEGTITATTVAEAEKLVALEFTPEQRQLLASSLPGQVRSFEARRRYGLTNSAAPAYAFDPRVPGVAYRAQTNRIRSS